MVATRSSNKKNMDEITSLLERKFDEFKESFMKDFQAQLDKLVGDEKNLIKEFINEKKTELPP